MPSAEVIRPRNPEIKARSPEPNEVTRLRIAMRRARIDNAERSAAITELRDAEIVRLELLRDEIAPFLAEVPPEIDLFDLALVPGERPRLFIDMIGFVEMARDRHSYRLLQDSRHGRILLTESKQIEKMVAAIADYLARRLLEREKALASDLTLAPLASANAQPSQEPAPSLDERDKTQPTKAVPRPRFAPIFRTIFSFLIDVLGTTILFALLALGGWQVFKMIPDSIWSSFGL
jgi:hypothetical protein